MFTPLTGRTVLVTGGTKGIGKGIAGVFARAGCNVVVSGRGAPAGAAAVRDLSALADGGAVSYVQADVAVGADCERMAAEVVERHGGIDVVCANAGVFPDRKLAEMTEEDIDAIFGTNVKGCMLTVKACLPHLERSGHGRVILDQPRSRGRSPASRAGRTTARPRRPSWASCARPASSSPPSASP